MGDTEINTFTDIVKTYMRYIEGDEDGGGEHEDTERGTCVCSRENGERQNLSGQAVSAGDKAGLCARP